jgi:hypothetical protein
MIPPATRLPPGNTLALASLVRRGVHVAPLRVLVYGVEGIGKTGFAAGAPDPVFVGTEDGYGTLDVARLPEPKTFAELMGYLRQIATEAHEFKTVVLDTLDHLEPLIWADVCAKAKVESIEEVGGGYGKGYAAALDRWREVVAALEALRARGMHVVLLAHSHLKTKKNPEGTDFDRYTLKINEKASGLFKEWCDTVLFANYAIYVDTKSKKDAKGKGYGGERVLYTSHRPAFDAKNRHDLPDEMPFPRDGAWAAFFELVSKPTAGAVARIAELRAQVETLRDQIGDADLTAKVNAWLAKGSQDPAKYDETIAKLRARERRQTETVVGAPAAPAVEPSAPAIDFTKLMEPDVTAAIVPAAAPPAPAALATFYQSVAEIELPGEAVGLWIKYRSELATVDREAREAAWQAICTRAETVGGMKNAKVWLKKAIAVEDARRGKPENDQSA